MAYGETNKEDADQIDFMKVGSFGFSCPTFDDCCADPHPALMFIPPGESFHDIPGAEIHAYIFSGLQAAVAFAVGFRELLTSVYGETAVLAMEDQKRAELKAHMGEGGWVAK